RATLWRLADMPTATAQAVFATVQIDAAMNALRRIAEAQQWTRERRAELEALSHQLGRLLKLRNDLIHFGAIVEDAEHFTVIHDATGGRAQIVRLSPSLLADAVTDLALVDLRLTLLAFDDEMPALTRASFDRERRRSWRYKPPA
ncbi:hypothetical protein, partial [Rhodovulum sp. PH10]|uniref:hypothetical protein n=1 Tax=Rhodovulum sp. PH10 TaxID=1187851 RepID=UPI00058F552F